MQKKSVLGTDPFKWLKENEKKENTGNQKSDIGGQKKQTEKPSGPVIDNEETGVKKEAKHEEKQEAKQEEKTFETSDISEVNRKAVLGKGVYDYHVKSSETTQKESPATAFVIVYTVLLLILGFIVYKDLTKQIDRLETKLELVEKQLDAGLINYEDTQVNDVW